MKFWSCFLFVGILWCLELHSAEGTTPLPLGTADLEGAFDQAAKAYVQPAAVDLDAVKWERGELGLAGALEIATAAVPEAEAIQSIERLQLEAGQVGYYAVYGYRAFPYTTRALQADGGYQEEERYRYQKVGVLVGADGQAVAGVPENDIRGFQIQSPEAARRVVPRRRVVSHAAAPKVSQPDALEIEVNESGYVVDGKVLDSSELDAQLATLPDATPIRVRASASLPHRDVANLINRLAKAGLRKVTFSTLE